MIIKFLGENNREYTYKCESIQIGKDGRDLYIVHPRVETNGMIFNDLDLIARFFDDSWILANPYSLLYDTRCVSFRIEPDDMDAQYTKGLQQGWNRGYAQGYAVGMLHSEKPNGKLIDWIDG